jgi:hypothetical protein
MRDQGPEGPRSDNTDTALNGKGNGSTARYIQLVRSAIDAHVEALSFDARAVFVDLLMRADFRTGRYVTTITDYSSFVGVPRRRLSHTIGELAGADLIVASFPRGHDGTVDIPLAVYESCVRTRGARAPYARHTRDARADMREPPGPEPRQTSDIDRSQTSDNRLRGIRDQWTRSTGKSVTDDDLARCLTYCRTDCLNVGADHRRIIDETLGKVDEQVARSPHKVNDLCGYLRNSVRQNAREALGMAS